MLNRIIFTAVFGGTALTIVSVCGFLLFLVSPVAFKDGCIISSVTWVFLIGFSLSKDLWVP